MGSIRSTAVVIILITEYINVVVVVLYFIVVSGYARFSDIKVVQIPSKSVDNNFPFASET